MAYTSGIYAIENTVNGKRYYGSSRRCERRKQGHWRTLRLGTHHNIHLQRAWNTYGEEVFRFEIILPCPVDQLLDHEQRFIDANTTGYNIAPRADRPDLSPESRAKQSQSLRGHKQSPETRLKRSLAMRGRKYSPEHRAKIAAAHRGRKMSPEHLARLVALSTGRVTSEETKEKLRKAMTGKKMPPKSRESIECQRRKLLGRKNGPLSAETKAKLSIALKGHTVSEETRRKIGDANRGRRWHHTEETRAHLKQVLRGLRRSPAGRENIRKARLAWLERQKAATSVQLAH